jgi:SDR family mycofactocin-dependent oxidoreductase
MGIMDGKVVLVSGAARGVGRALCVMLAEGGADVAAFDIGAQIASSSVPMGTSEDLDETRRLVEGLGRRCLSFAADARSAADIDRVVDETVAELGKIDAVAINHGIVTYATLMDCTEREFVDQFEVNLLGPFLIAQKVAAHMIDRGEGGAMTITASTAGLVAYPGLVSYIAAKHGVVGLAKSIAVELARHNIRCNSVCPGSINTTMIHDPAAYSFVTGKEDADWEEVAPLLRASGHKLPVDLVEPEDIAQAIVFLLSDAGRYITGSALPVDAGGVLK